MIGNEPPPVPTNGFKRIILIAAAIRIILLNPLVGTGGGSFPIIYEMQTGFWKGHSHNIFSDISLSYGIPSMIILFFVFLTIISFHLTH